MRRYWGSPKGRMQKEQRRQEGRRRHRRVKGLHERANLWGRIAEEVRAGKRAVSGTW